MINFRSVSDMDTLIRDNLVAIPNVDCIIGIPRSGMLPATLMALYLGKPLVSIEQVGQVATTRYSERIPLATAIKYALVVDDSCDSGNAMRKAKEYLKPFTDKMRFLYCAVFVTQRAIELGAVDFYMEQLEQPRLFEWNILDHNILERACVDLDGVLCANPTPEENDDGMRYSEFIGLAQPLFIPHHTIHSIVSCRLEKYRQKTELWLKEHDVKYNHLYLMNYKDAEMRRKIGGYGEYKADIYKKSGTDLFIESESFQAELIEVISHKPVYCVSTNTFYGGRL